MSKQGFHEDFGRTQQVKGGSNRAFGIVFAVVFVIIGLWPLLGGAGVRLWSLIIAGLFVAVAFLKPDILQPLNNLWTKFGLLLHKIVSPLIMGLIFFTTVVPTGLIVRLLGKDLLGLKLHPEQASYWIERNPPGPAPETMKNQF